MIRYLLIEKFGKISIKKNTYSGGSRFLFSDSSYAKFSNDGQLIYFCGPLEKVEKIAEYAMFDTFVETNNVEDIAIKLDTENREGEAEIRLYKNGLGYYFDRIKKRILIEKIPTTLSNITIIPSVYHEIALSYEDNEEIKDKILKRFRDIIFYQNQP